MDDLARIERNYGCVAEYNRCREEDEAYEWEQQRKRNEYCKANKAKLDAAGDKAMYFCDDCYDCKHYEDVGPTSWDSWGQDDVPHGICHHEEACSREYLDYATSMPMRDGAEIRDFFEEVNG